jgi:hypothetical protein
MSTIYKNFGVDFDTNQSDNHYKVISKTGEELNINAETLQLKQLNRTDTRRSINGYKIDQVFSDFKNAGLTDKLANFYTITLQNIADSQEVDVLSLYKKDVSGDVIITDILLNHINETLPSAVRFQNPVTKSSDKYVRLLIGA